jgi:hypothetical protein
MAGENGPSGARKPHNYCEIVPLSHIPVISIMTHLCEIKLHAVI